MYKVTKSRNAWAVQVYHKVGAKDGFWHTIREFSTKKEAQEYAKQ